MTKERKLAIEMWKGIRDMLSHFDIVTYEDIVSYKHTFCKNHNLNWYNNCWFCHYIPDCIECPLASCSDGSLYDVVVSRKKRDARVSACNGIIKALGGEV